MAFRPGSHVSDMTPDPSVDVSDWDETNDLHTSTPVTAELEQTFDITGHIMSPFYHRQLDYQDSRFLLLDCDNSGLLYWERYTAISV